jgi:hypothetical protein
MKYWYLYCFTFILIIFLPAQLEKGRILSKKFWEGRKARARWSKRGLAEVQGLGLLAWTFGLDFQVRAIVEGIVPVAAIIAIRRIGLLYRRRMMKQDSEASFCFKVGYCFKVNVQMSTSLKSRDFVLWLFAKALHGFNHRIAGSTWLWSSYELITCCVNFCAQWKLVELGFRCGGALLCWVGKK